MDMEERVREAKRQLSRQLLHRHGIHGVGIETAEDGTYILTVHIESGDTGILDQIPDFVQGFPVHIVRSGPYTKLVA